MDSSYLVWDLWVGNLWIELVGHLIFDQMKCEKWMRIEWCLTWLLIGMTGYVWRMIYPECEIWLGKSKRRGLYPICNHWLIMLISNYGRCRVCSRLRLTFLSFKSKEKYFIYPDTLVFVKLKQIQWPLLKVFHCFGEGEEKNQENFNGIFSNTIFLLRICFYANLNCIIIPNPYSHSHGP